MQRFVVAAFPVLWCIASWGQAALRDAGIYTCSDDQGRTITRDRYIEECIRKEQRVLNKDGSVRRVIPPTPTPDEQAQRQEEARAQAAAGAARNEAVKADRNLLERFPNEASHNRARESALGASRFAIQAAEARLRELAVERKRIDDEAEFYRGRRLPPALKQQLEGNDVAVAAQRNAIKNAQAEQQRINARFDAELDRLRKLWRGAPPGSLGPPPQ